MKQKYLLKILYVLILLAASSSNLSADDGASSSPVYNANEALLKLYGGSTWKNPDLGKYFKDKDVGYISLAFEASYIENGAQKHIVFAHITPQEGYACHACTPLIGGAIFVENNGELQIESANKLIGWGYSFGEEFKVEKCGPNKYAAIRKVADSHQGWETRYADFILPIKGKLEVALRIDWGKERPGPGACLGAPEQKLAVKFDDAQKTEYFDVIADLEYNDGNCEKFTVKKETIRYGFLNGKYERVKR